MENPSIKEGAEPVMRRSVVRDVCIAGMFLTRLPFRVSGTVHSYELARASRYFGLIGLIVGLAAGGVLLLAATLGLPAVAATLLALSIAVLLTGALHEDGLADMADGFGGGVARDDKLRIMHDSRTGVYGVLVLIFSIGLKAALLVELLEVGMALAALVAAAVFSRSLMPSLMALMRPARADGLAARAGRPSAIDALTALVIGAALLGGLLGSWIGLAAFVAGFLGALLVGVLAERQIGGYTGDVLGAAQQASELAIYLAVGVLVL